MTHSIRILLIERGARYAPSFAPALRRKNYAITIERSVQDAIDSSDRVQPDVVVLDAASMNTSGVRMARQLTSSLNGTPLILVSPEHAQLVGKALACEVLVQPFTSRKLINRIARVLPTEPEDEICAGPIRLDTAKRLVSSNGKKTRLTPKLVTLLKLLIKRQGQLVRREELMRQVWQTDYIGDMRTVDVHISWLRKAIEPDPSLPCYIKTIRGMGYRLDLPTATA